MSESLVGVREAAKHLGIHASTVSRQLAAGIIPNRGTPSAPLVDVEEARRAREDRVDPAKAKGTRRAAPEGAPGELPLAAEPAAPGYDAPPPDGSGGGGKRASYAQTRTLKLAYEARSAALDYGERVKTLTSVQRVEAAFAELAGVVQRGLAERARRLAARLVGLPDVNAVLAAIEEEDRRILEAMRDTYRREIDG